MANIRTSRKSGFLRGGVRRRETLWLGVAPSVTTLSGPSQALLFTGFPASILDLRPFTVVRVRGQLHVSSDQSGATENYEAALGMAIVSDQALAIGVTAVPTPFTDSASDLWFLYEAMQGRLDQNTTAGILETGHGRSFDSRAMRKVEDGQDLAISVETASTSAGAVIMKSGRMLLKLH